MCWWLALAKKKMRLWIASFGDPYNGDVIQLAEQLCSLSLPQMTKYFVMRECEHIILVTPVFGHKKEFIFKYPKGFWKISFRDLTILSLFCFNSVATLSI